MATTKSTRPDLGSLFTSLTQVVVDAERDALTLWVEATEAYVRTLSKMYDGSMGAADAFRDTVQLGAKSSVQLAKIAAETTNNWYDVALTEATVGSASKSGSARKRAATSTKRSTARTRASTA